MFAVVGGALLPSVLDGLVALRDDAGAVLCSGVLVAPGAVITAGHCADATQVRAGAGDREEAVSAVAIHPELDLAWLALDEDLPGRRWPVSTLLPGPGDEVSIAGVGATGDGADDAGTRRGAALEVVEATPDALLLFAPSANACSGDSGGPVTAARPDGIHLLALVVAVEPACLGGRTVALPLAGARPWLDAELAALQWGAWAPAPPAPRSGGCGGGAAVGVLLVGPLRRNGRGRSRSVVRVPR